MNSAKILQLLELLLLLPNLLLLVLVVGGQGTFGFGTPGRMALSVALIAVCALPLLSKRRPLNVAALLLAPVAVWLVATASAAG